MEFGKLTTPEAMEDYFQQMRAVSRTEILTKLYKTNPPPQTSIEAELSAAFTEIMTNYNYDSSSPIVREIMQEFDIRQSDLKKLAPKDRQAEISKRINKNLEEKLSEMGQFGDTDGKKAGNNPQHNAFDWVSVQSNFPHLRSIFQEILLEKVRLFDDELTELTTLNPPQVANTSIKPLNSSRLTTQGRTFSVRERIKTEPDRNEETRKKLKMKIDRNGFTNVLIRDHSQFTLGKWSRREEEQFREKMESFRKNFNKNGQKSPIIFQFVKQFTKTVKARDNISQKFENREKVGISPQELKYLCSTSLFLNKTLNVSEKNRLNRNIHALGKDLISKLEFNISEKIIETYKQFMKKVADLRAHYYEELTEKRKKEYSAYKKKEASQEVTHKKKTEFLKFKQIFANICKSERMKVLLNPRVARWVKLFIENMKSRVKKSSVNWGNHELYQRLSSGKKIPKLMLKAKLRCPSSRLIKRQDHSGYRHYISKNVATERFYYDKPFENHINKYNSIKIKNPKAFRRQLTGGPSQEQRNYIEVDMMGKQIRMTSPACLKAVIMIQAKWKSIYARRKFMRVVEDYREKEQIDFEDRKNSLRVLYPPGVKIDWHQLRERLKRVSMRNMTTFKPYERVVRKPINLYTSFSAITLSLNECKIKNILNTPERMAAFGRMVEDNDEKGILKSGYVLTSKEINEPYLREGGSIMWWSIKNSNIRLAKAFLEGGGNPNSRNQDNSTCLHEAIQNGNLSLIFLLLDYGGDLTLKNNKRQTPKFFATPKMLKWLKLDEPEENSREPISESEMEARQPGREHEARWLQGQGGRDKSRWSSSGAM